MTDNHTSKIFFWKEIISEYLFLDYDKSFQYFHNGRQHKNSCTDDVS